MISIIYGSVGAGKTYSSIKDFVIPSLKKNRNVFTNIDFFPKSSNYNYIRALEFYKDEIRHKFSVYLKRDCFPLLHFLDDNEIIQKMNIPAKDISASRIPPNSLIIVDEAQDIFYYLDVNRVPRGVYTFMSYSRHLGVDILFITQSPDLLNSQIRALARGNYLEVRNFSNLGLKNGYRLRWFSHHSQSPDEALKTSISFYDKSIFSLYRSQQAAGSEKPPNILLYKIYAIIFVVIVALILLSKLRAIFHF